MASFFISLSFENDFGATETLVPRVLGEFSRFRSRLADVSILNTACVTFSTLSSPDEYDDCGIVCQPAVGFGLWLPGFVHAINTLSQRGAVAVLEDDGAVVVRADSRGQTLRIARARYTCPPGHHTTAPGCKSFGAGIYVGEQDLTERIGEEEQFSIQFEAHDLASQVNHQARQFCQLVKQAIPSIEANAFNHEVYGNVLAEFQGLEGLANDLGII